MQITKKELFRVQLLSFFTLKILGNLDHSFNHIIYKEIDIFEKYLQMSDPFASSGTLCKLKFKIL